MKNPGRCTLEPGKTNEGWRTRWREEIPGFVSAIRGRLGEVVFKTYGRKIVVTRVPSFAGYEPTAAQRAQRERMREATAYAQRVYADAGAKAIYVAAAKQVGRQAFRLAVADHLAGRPRVTIAGPMERATVTVSPEGKQAQRRSPPESEHRRPPADSTPRPPPSRMHLALERGGRVDTARFCSRRSRADEPYSLNFSVRAVTMSCLRRLVNTTRFC